MAKGMGLGFHAGAENERMAESEPQGSVSPARFQTKLLFPSQKFCTGRFSPRSFLLHQRLQSKIRQTRSREKNGSGQHHPQFLDSFAHAGTVRMLVVGPVSAQARCTLRVRGQMMGQSEYPKYRECYPKLNQIQLMMACHWDSL